MAVDPTGEPEQKANPTQEHRQHWAFGGMQTFWAGTLANGL